MSHRAVISFNTDEIDALIWLLDRPVPPRTLADGRPANFPFMRESLHRKFLTYRAQVQRGEPLPAQWEL